MVPFTKSCGVRRLGVVLGLVAAAYSVLNGHPILKWQGRSILLRYTTYRSFDAIAIAVLWFFGVWLFIRVMAWAGNGFLEDYSRNSE
jgi:hypothetical protein